MTDTAHARVSRRPPADEVSIGQFAADVAQYLSRTPRQLPSRYLYDPLGSALFDAICRLPWYRVTRAETALLERHAAAILGCCDPLTDIVELGSGSGEKLMKVLASRSADSPQLRVHLVDVSRAALKTLERAGMVRIEEHDSFCDYSGLARRHNPGVLDRFSRPAQR